LLKTLPLIKRVGQQTMANEAIIERRNTISVPPFQNTVINDYVPFYFSIRTPMLFNIITGKGVKKRHQADIIYMVFKLTDLANDKFQWCFTDGNATKEISKWFTDLKNLNKIDWRSIYSTDFSSDNIDVDTDRIRKKHAEFLVKNHVPSDLITALIVYNTSTKVKVDNLLKKINFVTNVVVSPHDKFYFG